MKDLILGSLILIILHISIWGVAQPILSKEEHRRVMYGGIILSIFFVAIWRAGN